MKVGDIFESSNDGKFEIIEYLKYKKIKIKFLNTGYETWTTGIRVTDGSIKDKLKPTVCGVGYVGDGEYTAGRGSKGKSNPIYSIWGSIIRRCYSEKDDHHKFYKDCVVCDEWLNFQNFAKWFDENKPDDFEYGKYHIDKDMIKEGNKVYCPEFCRFVLVIENVAFALSKKANVKLKKISIKSPKGELFTFSKVATFSKTHDIPETTLRRAIQKQSKSFYNGWSIISVKEVSVEEFLENS